MKKFIAITVACISVMIFALFSSILLIDYNATYEKFLSKIKMDFSPEHTGQITIKKYPFPHLVIDSIKDDDTLELKEVKIKFSLLSLLKFAPEITSLKIGQARLAVSHQSLGLAHHDKLIAELIEQKGIDVKVNIKELLLLDNGHTVLTIKDLKLEDIGSDIGSKLSGTLEGSGSFDGSFTKDKDAVAVKVEISGGDFNLSLKETYIAGALSTGSVEVDIKNLPGLIVQKFPEVKRLLSSINTAEPIKVTFDLKAEEDSLQIKNCAVSSREMQGSGEAIISRSADLPNKMDFHFLRIDLISNNPEGNKPLPAEEQSTSASRFDFSKGTGYVSIKVDELAFSGDTLKNINIALMWGNGKLALQEFKGDINSGGGFRLTGNVTQNAYRSAFEGKVLIRHNDLNSLIRMASLDALTASKKVPFALSGDLKCTFIDFYLQNILLKTEDITVSGKVSTKLIGSTPRVSSILTISSLDVGKKEYPIVSPIVSYLYDLTKDMRSAAYVSKFIPIRTIGHIGHFDFTVNELTFFDRQLGKVNLLINTEPGWIDVHNIYINNGANFLSGDGQLSTKGIRPRLYLNITRGLLDINFLNPKGLLAIRNSLLNDYALDKVVIKADCNSLMLRQGGIVLEGLKFLLENDNTLLKFTNVEGNFLGGNIKASGSILLDPFTYNFVYALNSINLDALAKLLPSGLLKIGGVASLNGMFTTNGDSPEKQLYSLYTKTTILAKDVKLPSISVDDFINKINNPAYNLKDFDSDVKKALLTGQTQLSNIKAEAELTGGIISLKDVTFSTLNASGAAAAIINIYDFSINLSSVLSFYLIERMEGRVYDNRTATKMELKIIGNIFNPEKKADTTQLKKDIEVKKGGSSG